MSTPHKATAEQWAQIEGYAATDMNDDYASCLLDLRARVEALEAVQTAACPHVVSSDEGTSYCRLAEQSQDKLDRLIEMDRAATDHIPDARKMVTASSLVERVAMAIHPDRCADPNLYLHEARAAIREVAAWLVDRGGYPWAWVAQILEKEADR